ncbi:hypothetical protein [Nostoc sp.]
MNPFSSTAIYRLSCHNFIQYSFIWIGSSVIAAYTNSNQPSNRSFRLDNLTFGTNWIAQAEQDRFYQAMSTMVTEPFDKLRVTLAVPFPTGRQGRTGGKLRAASRREVRAAPTPRVSTKTTI